MSAEAELGRSAEAHGRSASGSGGLFAICARWVTGGRRIHLVVLLALIVLVAVLAGNRDRYRKADFHLYYQWWSEFARRTDPWQPPPAAAGQARSTVCNYTPPFVVFFSPLALLGRRAAFWVWQVFQVAALIGAIVLLALELRPRPGPRGVAAAVALALLYPQVHATLHGAQTALILLLLATAAWVLSRHRRDAAAGLALAIAVLLKAYPAAVGGYFLFRRRLGVVGWLGVFVIAGILATGLQRWREFFTDGIPTFNGYLTQERMVAVLCNVYQLPLHFSRTPFSLPLAIGISGAVILVLVALAAWATMLAVRDEPEVDGLCFGMWLAVALLAAPISYDHELPLLLPIFVFAFAGIMRGHKTPRVASALLVIAIAFAIVPVFWEWLRYFQLYCLSALATFAVAVIMVRTWSDEAQRPRAARMKGVNANALP